MKIALLHYSAPPVVGGVESVLGQHARLMAEAGHQVWILAGRGAQIDGSASFVQIPLMDSLHADILAIKKELDSGRVPTRFNELVKALIASLSSHLDEMDWVIAHNLGCLHKNLPLSIALWEYTQRKVKPRLILWHHDLAWSTPRYRDELHSGYPWEALRTAWLGAIQVTVSYQRQQELAVLMDIPLESIHVIPNGLDLARFHKLEEQTLACIRELDLLASEPLLLLPVRVTTRKNIELALNVLAILKERFPRATLVVTGPPGPHNPANRMYLSRLMDLRARLGLDGRVHFLAEWRSEYLPDMVVADLYHLADALFLPSREEGFGIPILEAGLAGLPIFCSDIPTLRELGGSEAVYFPPDGDPQEVAALIQKRLSSDPVFRLRARVRQNYTWEQIYTEKIAPLLAMR